MARKPRNLSAEEKRLWDNVAAKTSPLNTTARAPIIAKPVKKPDISPAPTSPKPIPPFEIGQNAGLESRTTARLSPTTASRVAAAPVQMDRKALRKITRGKVRPEARIDLHGMTLARAHTALIGFVMSSHADGRRLVLVITGKGRGDDRSDGPIPERRGVLREQVPGWLAAPPCSSVVLQVAQAHQSHGGGGAYYVYLRRKP